MDVESGGMVDEVACRDPDPGPAGSALGRIDAALSTAERLLTYPPPLSLSAFGLLHGAAVIAATEPVATAVPA